jgi:hypothetical protein
LPNTGEGARLSVVDGVRRAFERRHVVLDDLEIDGRIATHVIGVGRLGQGEQPELQVVADAELRYADAVLGRQPDKHGMLQRHAMCDRRVCLDKHVLRSAIVDKIEPRVADMRQHLIDRGLHRVVSQDVVEVCAFEVRDTDRAELAGLLRFLQRAPRLNVAGVEVAALAELHPRLWAVDQHQVDVTEPERLKRTVGAVLGIGVALRLCDELGGDEKLVSRNAAPSQALADATLVPISLSRVEVAVADRDGVANDLCDRSVIDPPSAETQLRNQDAIGKGEGFIQDHRSFLRPAGCSP